MVTSSHRTPAETEVKGASKEMMELAQAIALSLVESLQKISKSGTLPDDLKKLLNSDTSKVRMGQVDLPGSDRPALKPVADDALIGFSDEDDSDQTPVPPPVPTSVPRLELQPIDGVKRATEDISELTARYELVSKLDEDHSSGKYLGRDLQTNARVIVHIASKFAAKNPIYLERFSRLAPGFMKLDHQSVVKLLAHGMHKGSPFYVLESVPGKSLADIIPLSGPIPELDAIRICIQLAEALQYVHKKLYAIHGELRLASIYISYSGVAGLEMFSESEILKVTDFFREQTPWHEEGKLPIMATPLYTPPERLAGEASFDVRSDIYAIGALLYHMVTGHPPYPGTSKEVRQGHLTGEIPDAALKLPSLSTATCDIIKTALAKNVGDRFLSYQGFIVACKKVFKAIAPPDSSSMRILRRPMTLSTDIGTARLTKAGKLSGKYPKVDLSKVNDGRKDEKSDAFPVQDDEKKKAATDSEIMQLGVAVAKLISGGASGAYKGIKGTLSEEEFNRLKNISTRIVRKYVELRHARGDEPDVDEEEDVELEGGSRALERRKTGEGKDEEKKLSDTSKLRRISTRIVRRHLKRREEGDERKERSPESIGVIRKRIMLRSPEAARRRRETRASSESGNGSGTDLFGKKLADAIGQRVAVHMSGKNRKFFSADNAYAAVIIMFTIFVGVVLTKVMFLILGRLNSF